LDRIGWSSPSPAACSLDLYAHADYFFCFSHHVSSTFIPHIRDRIECFPFSCSFALLFRASYPIFPFLRVLCSERFFFSRFWADQIGNQKLLSPVKSLFVNACPILFACRRKKSDTKFQRASHSLFSVISLYPLLSHKTHFLGVPAFFAKYSPNLFSPCKLMLGSGFSIARAPLSRFLDLRPAFRMRVSVRACVCVCVCLCVCFFLAR